MSIVGLAVWEAALTVLLLFNLALTLALIRGKRQVRSAPKAGGLEVGATPRPVKAVSLDGTEWDSGAVMRGRATVLFVMPSCGPCRDSLPEFAALSRAAAQQGESFVLASSGDAAATRDFLGSYADAVTVVLAPRATNRWFSDWSVTQTPFFTRIDGGRVVASGIPYLTNPYWADLVGRWRRANPTSPAGIGALPADAPA